MSVPVFTWHELKVSLSAAWWGKPLRRSSRISNKYKEVETKVVSVFEKVQLKTKNQIYEKKPKL